MHPNNAKVAAEYFTRLANGERSEDINQDYERCYCGDCSRYSLATSN